MDHLLVRSQGEGGFNGSVGEPVFLQDAMHPFTDSVDPLPPLQYPILGGQPELIQEIKSRYCDPSLHVVVANGAKQGIMAALYAYGQRGFKKVYHREPYWLSYKTLVELSGATFTTRRTPWSWSSKAVTINTTPNNPDGAIDSAHSCDIWDAAYSHSVYGFSREFAPIHTVSVWSAAKLLGVSGLRVGWVVTHDKELADHAASYVEKTTSGVSTASQVMVAGIMRAMARNPERAAECYRKARNTLNYNKASFNRYISPHCGVVKGLPAHGTGMFAFFRPLDFIKFESALHKSQVKVVPGHAFGSSYEGWYRMSLGHRANLTEQALMRLAQELA